MRIFLKKSIQLSVKTVISAVLNTQTLKMIKQSTNIYDAIKITKKSLKEWFGKKSFFNNRKNEISELQLF